MKASLDSWSVVQISRIEASALKASATSVCIAAAMMPVECARPSRINSARSRSVVRSHHRAEKVATDNGGTIPLSGVSGMFSLVMVLKVVGIRPPRLILCVRP